MMNLNGSLSKSATRTNYSLMNQSDHYFQKTSPSDDFTEKDHAFKKLNNLFEKKYDDHQASTDMDALSTMTQLHWDITVVLDDHPHQNSELFTGCTIGELKFVELSNTELLK